LNKIRKTNTYQRTWNSKRNAVPATIISLERRSGLLSPLEINGRSYMSSSVK